MKFLNNPQGFTKTDVGLGNVDNTADVNKPVSIAQQSVINNLNARPVYGQPTTNLGNPSVLEMGMMDAQATNKIWFTNPANLAFDTSPTGATWTVKTVADIDKKKLVSGQSSASILIPKGTQLRITWQSDNYVFLNWLYLYTSTNGDNIQIRIEERSSLSNVWSLVTDFGTSVSNWPGHVTVPHDTIPFADYADDGHFDFVRVTIKAAADTTGGTYPSMNLYGISWWGGYPTGRREIYDWDSDKNVYFPADVVINDPVAPINLRTALAGKKNYTAPTTVSFMDDFTRANATGYVAVGNGWTPGASGADANIVSNDLVRTDTAGYRLFNNMAAGVTLPADYTVTAVMATSGASNARFFYGLVGRWNGTEGVRAMFTTDGLNIEIGNASSYGAVNIYSGAPTLPATWTNAGDHTLAMRMTGTLIELICDGTVVVTTNCSTNYNVTGTGFGICGEGNNKVWRSIGASGTTGGGEIFANGSVTTAAIADAAVTPAKMSIIPALDSAVVHNTGNETVTGIKSFSSPVIITSENWIAATLTNSWTNYAGTYELAGYRKMADGTVMLRGLVKTGTVAVAIFTLPVAYRPALNSIWQQTANLGTCRMSVLASTGSVQVDAYISPGTSGLVSLSGIRFSVNG